MKVYKQLLLVFALGATAQQASPPPTGQPPLHTFPPVIDTTELVPSGGSLPTTPGTKVAGTSSGSGSSATETSAASASGSGSAATTSGTRTSTGLAAPTAQVNIAPIFGIAAAVVVL
ncbi:hypothetical protein MGU_04637 [Metarhizium guizhouense ARSEF 977]|uniref:Uncharacterized protein n=1 Tax=Metarhizium guizhouense (strain ARSEF 977) TaxID=1276136 RepID=A0A0B4H861_METGA|nr:hypothetical protein MGU_04637 [Metarhizium guizhouense ARSEF 977]